jgi:hypothetical protein
MSYYADVDPAKAGAAYRFSRALVESCQNDDKATSGSNFTIPCSVFSSGTVLRALNPEAIDSLLFNDLESSDTIYRDQTTRLSFIGDPIKTSLRLGGGELELSPRFTASTFAMNTSCSRVLDCKPASDSQGKNYFKCGSNFTQYSPGAWFAVSLSENPRDLLNSNSWYDDNTWAVYAPYPEFHIEPSSQRLLVNSKSAPVAGSFVFVLKCVSTLSTIRYEWADGKMTRLLDLAEANKTLLNIQRAPLFSNYSFKSAHLESFASRLKIGGDPMEPRSYDRGNYTEQYANLLSEIGLGFLGGSIEPRAALSLQLQNETVITQVAKAPLFVLVILNFWYALTGFCLFLLACHTTNYGHWRADVQAVQQLLTVTGITTAAVSKDRPRQRDSVRIGVEKVGDEWQFKVWEQNKDLEDAKDQEIDQQPTNSPDHKASNVIAIAEVVPCGSDLSQGSAEDIALVQFTTNDVRCCHAEGDTLSAHDSVSSASSHRASMFGDDEAIQLLSQSLIWTDGSEQESNNAVKNPASLNEDTSSSSRASQRSIDEYVSLQ